jgi:lantibiotic leader peptide-processing serine protease
VLPSATATDNACRTDWSCDTGTFWHGTHVAGIVAAAANGIGTVGIAPEATIVPVKALHSGTGSFGAILSAVLYAATDGKADIINMSLGATLPKGGRDVAELMSALNRVANFAARQGVLVVASAGNDAADLDHNKNLIKVPAEVSTVLSISSTGPLGFGLGNQNFARFASYSNYGSSGVTLAAPGGDFALEGDAVCTLPRTVTGVVTNFCWVFDMVMSTTRGGTTSTSSYGWAAGTSMASPAAAAVAAMIKQKYPHGRSFQVGQHPAPQGPPGRKARQGLDARDPRDHGRGPPGRR